MGGRRRQVRVEEGGKEGKNDDCSGTPKFAPAAEAQPLFNLLLLLLLLFERSLFIPDWCQVCQSSTLPGLHPRKGRAGTLLLSRAQLEPDEREHGVVARSPRIRIPRPVPGYHSSSLFPLVGPSQLHRTRSLSLSLSFSTPQRFREKKKERKALVLAQHTLVARSPRPRANQRSRKVIREVVGALHTVSSLPSFKNGALREREWFRLFVSFEAYCSRAPWPLNLYLGREGVRS